MIQVKSSARGSILIIVLWISIGLAGIALTFGHSAMMAYRGSDNELAGQQAQWAVEGGARYAMQLLASSTTPGVMPETTEYQAEAVAVGEATFWFLGGAGDDTSYASTKPVFALVDEASKINLNMDPALLTKLLQGLPTMPEELAEAIKDWVDADSVVTGSGAEAETYSLRKPGYSAKNTSFESLEELALVNGTTFEVLYGEDANLNGVLDPNEDDGDESAPADNADGKLDPGLLSYFTCYSRTTNRASDGSDRVDVSRSSAALIQLLATAGVQAGGNPVIPAPAAGGGANPTAATYTSVMHYYLQSGISADDFGKIIDRLWIDPANAANPSTPPKTYIDGLININTAGEAVLTCIPGIEDKALDVVTARQGRSTKDTNIAWLVDVIGPANALRAGPYITGETAQISADVAAVGRHGRGYRRTKFVIDNSTGTPRIIHRRDLSSLGWALGSDTRQTLGARKEETR